MEEKYYVIEIATGDIKIQGKSIYEYNDLTTAIANFHSKLGVAMKSELYTSDLIIVIDNGGAIWKSERFVRNATETE